MVRGTSGGGLSMGVPPPAPPGLLGDVGGHGAVQVCRAIIISILGPLDEGLQVNVVIVRKVARLLAVLTIPGSGVELRV